MTTSKYMVYADEQSAEVVVAQTDGDGRNVARTWTVAADWAIDRYVWKSWDNLALTFTNPSLADELFPSDGADDEARDVGELVLVLDGADPRERLNRDANIFCTDCIECYGCFLCDECVGCTRCTNCYCCECCVGCTGCGHVYDAETLDYITGCQPEPTTIDDFIDEIVVPALGDFVADYDLRAIAEHASVYCNGVYRRRVTVDGFTDVLRLADVSKR